MDTSILEMRVELPEHIDGKCVNCLTNFSYPSSGLEHDSSSHERAAGMELEHTFNVLHSCSACKHQHIIALTVYEYPRGFVNLIEPSIHGVRLNSNYSDWFKNCK